jgi:hypothetical protein
LAKIRALLRERALAQLLLGGHFTDGERYDPRVTFQSALVTFLYGKGEGIKKGRLSGSSSEGFIPRFVY